MATFAGINFPDLPSQSPVCDNWHFLDDDIGWSLSNSNLFYEGTNLFGLLLSELSTQVADGTTTNSGALAILELYKLYLIDGLETLGSGGDGTSAGGWSGAYWNWSTKVGIFGGGNSESCEQNRWSNQDAHAYVNIMRWNYMSFMDVVNASISAYEQNIGNTIDEAELEAYIADLVNETTELNTDTTKLLEDINVIKFGNLVEYFAIGGAVLILAFMGYKTLK